MIHETKMHRASYLAGLKLVSGKPLAFSDVVLSLCRSAPVLLIYSHLALYMKMSNS
jgi:hypothetical protein